MDNAMLNVAHPHSSSAQGTKRLETETEATAVAAADVLCSVAVFLEILFLLLCPRLSAVWYCCSLVILCCLLVGAKFLIGEGCLDCNV